MDLLQIKKLTTQGEGLHLEFKKKANFPEKIAKELVAFANTEGGLLLLGVDDDGTVSGTRDIEGEVFIMEDTIEKLIRPRLNYQARIIKINEKKGLAIFEVPKSEKKPLYLRNAPVTKEGKVYVRHGDQSLQASKEMREILRRRSSEKDIHFTFGEKEQMLMKLLDEHKHITLIEFSKEAKISKFVASRTLIRLVLANVIEISPKEGEDLYFRK
ncbi:MAG: putative HTH transcriptional regulator [Roseivirga sp.]|jgi:predicted HTH transcriptional regulator